MNRFHTDHAMLTNPQPLGLEGVLNVAMAMVHDGDVEGANELVTAALARTGGSLLLHHAYLMLVGARSTLSAIIGHRQHQRTRRADAAVRRSANAAVRRSLRSVS